MTHLTGYTFAYGLTERGLGAVPELLRVLINNTMQVECSTYLQAEEYERTEERKEYATGTSAYDTHYQQPGKNRQGNLQTYQSSGMFPNEASCLRLISALLMEISEEWQIGKHYCAGKSFKC